ncbi:MAG: hypothetical protein M3R65_05415 [Gemmatimonadota bacterium]|nr:hypothetical protein [Gemmatimonadota bacterium]
MIPAPKRVSGFLSLLAFAPLNLAVAQSGPATSAVPDSSYHTTHGQYWRNLVSGFATSILAHEAGHVGMSLALGAHPSIGLEHGKPTVYSGIDATLNPRKQFLFASAGLDVQTLLDEAILDIPHHRGGPFERGILAGGIATAYFYATIGRNAGNSDITYMARTSSLNRTQVSLIYAGIATVQSFRIARDGHYANFFIRPAANGTISVGVAVLPNPE